MLAAHHQHKCYDLCIRLNILENNLYKRLEALVNIDVIGIFPVYIINIRMIIFLMPL